MIIEFQHPDGAWTTSKRAQWREIARDILTPLKLNTLGRASTLRTAEGVDHLLRRCGYRLVKVG